MRKVELHINKCSECPHFSDDLDVFCLKAKRVFSRSDTPFHSIPEWCPLPKVEEE